MTAPGKLPKPSLVLHSFAAFSWCILISSGRLHLGEAQYLAHRFFRFFIAVIIKLNNLYKGKFGVFLYQMLKALKRLHFNGSRTFKSLTQYFLFALKS